MKNSTVNTTMSIKTIKAAKGEVSIIIKTALIWEAVNALKTYGIERFDSCKIDWETNDLFLTAVAEPDCKGV